MPADVVEVSYDSGNLKLKAWLSPATSQNQHASAVLFLHGGFAFAADDWAMTRPYRDAGFVVLVPMLRGENGLPGDYSFFFDEVDDVLAAADALSRVPYVRADHIYIAGHSAGGTLAMLASMASNRFRAAASFSGSPDQVLFARGWPQLVPFDPTDASELLIRSPIEYPTSFQCPARLYFGSQERAFATSTTRLAERAQAATLDVVARSVAGDHFSAVAEEMALSIAFFREKD